MKRPLYKRKFIGRTGTESFIAWCVERDDGSGRENGDFLNCHFLSFFDGQHLAHFTFWKEDAAALKTLRKVVNEFCDQAEAHK